MSRHRPTVSISKSSPSIITFSADTKKLIPRPSEISSKRLTETIVPDNNRRIVKNPDKGGAVQRKPYLIMEKGVNYTPKALNDPSFPSAGEKQFAGLPAAKPLGSARLGKIPESPSTSSMHSLVSRFSFSRKSSATPSVFSTGFGSFGGYSWSGMAPEDEEEFTPTEDRAPSMFRLREDPPPRKVEIKTEFKVNLVESETMFLLDLPTSADWAESKEGKSIAEMNEYYDKKLETNKSISHAATQTGRVFLKHRKLHMPRNDRGNSAAYATVWDIYDTYECQKRDSITSGLLREEGQVDSILVSGEEDKYGAHFEFCGSKLDGRFLNALMVMERLIEKQQFSERQLLYQGMFVQDPLSLDVKCNYSLAHLWTFRGEQTKQRKVTSMCWSAENDNLLAVGYGKFKYTDKCTGMVCVWNVKNPHHPERQFKFDDPVTFVTFSHYRPQILAVTFYSGLVLLIDVINRSLMVKASNHNYPLYHPVWQAQWLPCEGRSVGPDLITCGKNGIVFKYKKTKFFMSKKIMSMARPHGRVQGVEQPRKCYPRKTLTSPHPSAEVLVLHPTDPLIYLVGTSEGCVYTCSVNYRRDHKEVFVAHNGPVYNIQFNPFCSKVFLTCGADWCVRIWAEGVFDPLATLESGMSPVQDALWNPLHSTIIVSITGAFIEIWDIRRRTSTPKSSTESPSKSFNTVLQFTKNKFNVCVGDVDGNVHVMALTEMPFSPGFQEEVLVQSLQNALISHPEILEKLLRLGPPFAHEGPSLKHKMFKKLGNLQQGIQT